VERGRAVGADLLALAPEDDLVGAAREWAGDEGPEVVFEATGVPELVQTAVRLVARRGDALAGLVTHEFALDEAPAAIDYAIRHPAEVMKAMIRLEDP
jgi:threonine dehydrogenase-like Zn-dependent dehydrogenase